MPQPCLPSARGRRRPGWSRLTVPTIAAFVQTRANRLGPSARRSPVTAAPTFLRFLATRGVIPAGIEGAVPTIRKTTGCREIGRPRVHEPPPAFEQVRARVGRLGPLAHDVRQRRLDDLARTVGALGRPVPERRAEAVRPGPAGARRTEQHRAAYAGAAPPRRGRGGRDAVARPAVELQVHQVAGPGFGVAAEITAGDGWRGRAARFEEQLGSTVPEVVWRRAEAVSRLVDRPAAIAAFSKADEEPRPGDCPSSQRGGAAMDSFRSVDRDRGR